ncbi:hypothetical protein K432DRAFT_381962 [Lepidopterella palustris CBS 459.81]|uniref:Uncharacterized protein n=1 Tax=Lepidopterella palustris CBS 459.81 TaxID=1314670 RepID=A0A8E2EBF1_9PEZI|nr:hypothetical protein K432DRAFT_381962 [Lepidopterella palustris CBS 459.81]
MPTTPCPLPEVEAALSPYIHTRQETFRIRQTIASHLASQLTTTNESETDLSHFSLGCPPPSLRVKRIPPEFTGTRRNYLEVLQANIAARDRYNELKSDLDELRNQHVTDSTSRVEAANDQEATHAYITLLRQRRRLEKLQIIQKSLDKLVDAQPNPGHKDMKTLLKETIGEQPDLPTAKLGEQAADPQLEELMLRLKKEVLGAKRAMDEANERRTEAQRQAEGRRNPGLQEQVYALRCARDELVEWVEGELAKLVEEEESVLEDLSPVKKQPNAEVGHTDERPYQEQLQERYEKYVAARASLISTVDGMSASGKGITGADGPKSKSLPASLQDAIPTLKVADILPYLPSLLQTARDERSLLQQTTYFRHQLASASEEILRTIRRLAGESHLAAPGSTTTLAWANAAKEATASTTEDVEGNLEEAKKRVRSAKQVLDDVQSRRENFERLGI